VPGISVAFVDMVQTAGIIMSGKFFVSIIWLDFVRMEMVASLFSKSFIYSFMKLLLLRCI
jgi:hypothetical protein